ncbi:MAG: DNA mismatch repair protein MutS, partial [Chitinophagia bacterium]|nr:DNA mismatch repair protein MutS [Chitinophagia bacterium]
QGDRMEFLRTLQPGGSSHSFGLHVARMAGVPAAVIHEAETMLEHLESMRDESAQKSSSIPTPHKDGSWQMSLWGEGDTQALELLKSIKSLDVNAISPLQALQWLIERQNEIKS